VAGGDACKRGSIKNPGPAPSRESDTDMAISEAKQLDTSEKWHDLLVFGIILAYLSAIAILVILKKYEFAPFQEVRENFTQFNPFDGKIIHESQHMVYGKGIVVKSNTLCNSIIDKSPEFDNLFLSQNILGELCAENPFQVNFVVYIKYDRRRLDRLRNRKKVVYQLQKKVAIVNWQNKELMAQKNFTKNYTFIINKNGKTLEADKRLCIISEEPSDEEVKHWIYSLVVSEQS